LGVSDSYGDGCSWYDSNPASCGNFDDYDFTASDVCCACSGGTATVAGCTDTSATDSYGDGCGWYANNPEYCGSFDDGDFAARSDCCACRSYWGTLNLQDTSGVPEWEIDLDYAQADEYIAELEGAYEEYQTNLHNMFSEWAEAKQTIDNYYWNYELMPLFEEKASLDERTLRTIITWLADGTQVKGKPLVEVFPGVEEYMLDNYNPYGLSLADKFGLNGSPLSLQEWAGADFWAYVDCVVTLSPPCAEADDFNWCYDNLLQNTCDGYDTWNDDFYTCFITEGDDCTGM